jgi:hypothetical protein
MKNRVDFWLGIAANVIWIGLGGVCLLSVGGVISELATWWLFGIGLIAGGVMGLISLLRAAKE